MEWWNIGMLILRERYSFMNFAVNRNFPNKPLSHLPKTHYSNIPIGAKPLSSGSSEKDVAMEFGKSMVKRACTSLQFR